MSIRIHVIASFGAVEEEFRRALNSSNDGSEVCRPIQFGSNGNWHWAHASVWIVNGADIDTAIAKMSVPALRVTSSDGVLWTITLTAPGMNSFRGVHRFTEVGYVPDESESDEDNDDDDDNSDEEFDEVAGINRYSPELQFLWDEGEEARLKKEMSDDIARKRLGLDEYTDYGATLPDSVIDQMKQQSPDLARHTAFTAHGRQIVDALEAFGFKFDHDAMLKLLTVGPLTEFEDDSEIGNMPRFLNLLGIDGIFTNVTDTDQSDTNKNGSDVNEGPDWSEFSPGELFGIFDPLIESCPLTHLDFEAQTKQPVPILHFFAHLLSENPKTFVKVNFIQKQGEPSQLWTQINKLEAKITNKEWQFCFDTPPCWWHQSGRDALDDNELGNAIGTLPNGVGIEITMIVNGLKEKCHRYSGVLDGGNLHIAQVYPAIAKNEFGRVMELVGQAFERTPIDLLSEKEEEAVRKKYKRSYDEVAPILNGQIKPIEYYRGLVVQTLLFERFRDHRSWDVSSAEQGVESEWQQFDELTNGTYDSDNLNSIDKLSNVHKKPEITSDILKKMLKEIARSKKASVAPHGGTVLYKGRTGKFFQASMSKLKHVSKKQLAQHDASMKSLGFSVIGDSVGDVDQRQEITRCYAGNSQAIALHAHRTASNLIGFADTAGGVTLVDFSQGTSEFHSHFDDGTSLVTTSIDAASSKPKVGIYVRSYEDIPVKDLWQKHLDGIGRFRNHRDATPIDHTTFGEWKPFLAKIDGLLSRFIKAS